jgi:adenine-specific DNA glycosylase
MSNKSIESFAEQIYPKGKSSEWHQALMDIGAQFCKANQATCEFCPLQEHCSSAFNVRIEKKKVGKTEPSHRGIPNRIWRGRIIEFLRNANEYRTDKYELLRGIFGESIDEKDQTWFEERISPALIKDHLIHYDSQTNIISISQ